MERLANGVTSPTQLLFRLALAQAKSLDGFRHEPPPLGTVERFGCLLQEDTHGRCQVHSPPPVWAGGHCTDFQRTNYFRVVALEGGHL
jgi:hypothetical protein